MVAESIYREYPSKQKVVVGFRRIVILVVKIYGRISSTITTPTMIDVIKNAFSQTRVAIYGLTSEVVNP